MEENLLAMQESMTNLQQESIQKFKKLTQQDKKRRKNMAVNYDQDLRSLSGQPVSLGGH